MGTDARALPGRSRVMPWSRVMGLGSVYAKTVRDSRRAGLAVGILAGLLILVTALPYSTEFTTPASRQQLLATMLALPASLRGLLGEPINLEVLGGWLSFRVGNLLPVLLGLWPVIALSGTLAGEAAKGSLDVLVSTPHSRRSIAIQKVAAHVTVLSMAMLIASLITFVVGQAFAVLPGDEITFAAALGHAALFGLLMLASGAVAFATAPVVGRTRAIGLGLLALFGMYIVWGYSTLSPALDALSPISWYSWTAGHRPLAGLTDWPSVGLLAVVVIGLLAVGVLVFERRDLGSTAAMRWLRLPGLPAGTGGPFSRQLADHLPGAIAWGGGIGLYAALIAASADALTESLNQIPGLIEYVNTIYPGIDFGQPSGVLQLAFFAFGSLMAGLAGATFLAGWASDEGNDRLDLVLSTPVSRVGWALRSGLGVMAALGVFGLVLGGLVVIAVATQGGDVTAPVLGAVIVALVAAGFAGVGFAVGGLVRASLAAPVAAALAVGSFLLETLGSALQLPEVVLDLSIYRHLGQPMAGTYDPVGIVAAVALAIGGLLVGAYGLRRRDLGR